MARGAAVHSTRMLPPSRSALRWTTSKDILRSPLLTLRRAKDGAGGIDTVPYVPENTRIQGR